jgi:predicted Zn-dependent protease
LDKTHQSARGLLQFFQILQGTELLTGIRETPYLRTHPLTSQRVDYVRNHVEHSPYSDVPDPPEWVELHKRMKAKLIAFLNAPSYTFRLYPPSDNSVAARYARAIANYRIPDLKKAVDLMDGLIKDEPKNPFFYEMKGQMLFENGHVREALGPYHDAVRLAPDIALLKVELGQVEIESEDPALLKDAITQLRSAVIYENRNPEAWHFLGVAYGKSGDEGNALLALAEESMANGDPKNARGQADRAAHMLPFGSPGQLRAQDIKFEAEHAIKDNK